MLDLAEQFLERSNLPAKADVDAVHIAAATVHGMDYFLSMIDFISGPANFIYFSVNGIFETKNPKVFFISNEIFYVLS